MSSLLLRNLRSVITCDDGDAVLEHTDLYCEDGVIRAMGPDLPQTADTVMDGSRYWCYPGLINTHHHLYQVFSRNLPQVQNLELFDWLTALYEIWKGLDEVDVLALPSLDGVCVEWWESEGHSRAALLFSDRLEGYQEGLRLLFGPEILKAVHGSKELCRRLLQPQAWSSTRRRCKV